MQAEAHTGINIIMVASLHFLAAFRASASVFPPFLQAVQHPPAQTHVFPLSIIVRRSADTRHYAAWPTCRRADK